MSISDKIKALTQQLYPTGILFKIVNRTWKNAFTEGLIKSEVRAYTDTLGILSGLLPDNDEFTANDAARWESALKLTEISGLTLNERKMRISRKIGHPGGVLNRQSSQYLQGQLHDAGFTNLFVYDNLTNESPNAAMGESLEAYQLDNAQCGQRPLAQIYPKKIINSKVNDYDKNFMWGLGNLTPTFFVSGDPITSTAQVNATRESELRELILKIKPAGTVGYLNINFI